MGIKGRTLTAGDFCEATEATLATAMAHVEAMDTPDHAKYAKAATQARKVAVANAPGEIKSEVLITAAAAGAAQAGFEGTPDEFAVEPQSLEQVADATNACKAWTERNCPAEIADRWSGM